jgi:uncharacterized secreted protein with C-terminal beta-propeller domain
VPWHTFLWKRERKEEKYAYICKYVNSYIGVIKNNKKLRKIEEPCVYAAK